ncbi:hypothetical protein BH11PSE11_BH11PSE11_35070 [soil metagenome]
MDLNKLRTAVFEKTGIRIDTNDPVFALVALNEAVLAECVEQQVRIANDATEKLAQQTSQLLEAGERNRKLLVQLSGTANTAGPNNMPAALLENPEVTETSRTGGPSSMQMIVGAASVAILTSALTLTGLWIARDRSLPAQSQLAHKPAVPAPAPALTPEQLVLIRDGERFARMWSRLDEATQLKIQGLIDQP